jgi:hypothetical protein
MTYIFAGDYKAQFSAEVTKLIAKNNADGFTSRTDKMSEVQRLTDAYIAQTGEPPESSELERLTDAILSEELKSTYRAKATASAYPFLSDRQLLTRNNNETPISAAHYHGSDGGNYRIPTKRKRSWYENSRIDKKAKIRNDERRKQYRMDTAPGLVVTYTMSPEDVAAYLTEKYGRKLA